MEFQKITHNSMVRRGLLAGTLVLGLTACDGPNYDGEGNEFVVHGVVTDSGKESLKARIYQIDQAQGKADDWFDVNKVHQLHDNCDCHGTWLGRKQYGVVIDRAGIVIEPSQVAEQSCVVFSGRIRSDQEGKSYNNRPVYDSAQIVECDADNAPGAF